MIKRSNNPKERVLRYKAKITLMTVILMIFTTLSLVFGLSFSSSLQSQSYLPFSIPSTLLGSAAPAPPVVEKEVPEQEEEEEFEEDEDQVEDEDNGDGDGDNNGDN